jgi:hypothetical protein
MLLGLVDGRIVVCDLGSGRTREEKAHEASVMSISSNEKFFAAGSSDCNVSVWSLKDLVQLKVLRGHRYGVGSVLMNERYLVTMGWNRILVYDMGLNEIAAMSRKGFPLSNHCASLHGDVLTVCDLDKIRKVRLNGEKGGWENAIQVKEEMVSMVSSRRADEVWVGTAMGFLLKVNLDEGRIATRLFIGDHLRLEQVMPFQEFLMCLLLDGESNSATVLAFEMEDLRRREQGPVATYCGLQDVSFREVAKFGASSDLETRGEWMVAFNRGKMVARSVGEIRAMQKRKM